MTLRDELRALPTFPDDLPELDPGELPGSGLDVVVAWLREAVATGERQANAMTFTTVGADGVPTSRTLIVKEVDDRGIHVASSRSSRKGRDLAAHPVATMLFFWRPLGRQLEVTGAVEELDEETGRRDWRDRPGAVGENPDWRVWRLVPDRVELMQARHDRRHTRVEYRRDGDGWHRRLSTASEVPSGSTS